MVCGLETGINIDRFLSWHYYNHFKSSREACFAIKRTVQSNAIHPKWPKLPTSRSFVHVSLSQVIDQEAHYRYQDNEPNAAIKVTTLNKNVKNNVQKCTDNEVQTTTFFMVDTALCGYFECNVHCSNATAK